MTQNFAGIGFSSDIIFEEGVALPTAPLNLALSIVGEGSFRIVWDIPVDTGIGDQTRPILSYAVLLRVSESESVIFLSSDKVAEVAVTEAILQTGVNGVSIAQGKR